MTLDKQHSWEELTGITLRKLLPNLVEPHLADKFREWMLEREPVGYGIDSILISKCFHIGRKLRTMKDVVIVILGDEGDGKTTLSAWLGAWVSLNRFSHDCMTLEKKEYYNKLKTAEVGDVVTVDEGGLALFSREAMTRGGRDVIKTLMTVRKKCLCLIICIPSFSDLDKYVRQHRCNIIIDIRSKGKYVGYLYHDKVKQIINENINKYKKLSLIKIPSQYLWKGYWRKGFPKTVDEAAYDKKKDEHIDLWLDKKAKESEEDEKPKEERGTKQEFFTTRQAAKVMGISCGAMQKRCAKKQIKARKIGTTWSIPISEIFCDGEQSE